MKAIQTNYRGVRYRSRTEARWAVFFDKLGIEAIHEGEGYDLNGQWYLCDFWLPASKTWFEVKGIDPNDLEIEKARRLSEASGRLVLIAVGHPSIDDDVMNLIAVRAGHRDSLCQFVDYGRNDVFVAIGGDTIITTIKGSESNLGGAPYPEEVLKAARAAQAERFGVHE